MNLSLSEAARLLGKTDRQMRYLIRTGKLPARKRDGRWVIRREDLPLSAGQEKAVRQKSERAAMLALDLLGPDLESKTSKKMTSIRQMRAFNEGVPLYRDLTSQLGEEHPAVELLRESLMLFSCGYYEFKSSLKAELYARARQQASRAAMTLLLAPEANDELIDRLEGGYLPVLGGLIHQAEKRRARR